MNCHSNGTAEGAFAQRILSFVPLGTDQTLHDLAPPNLAGSGEKLNVKAMQGVIDGKTRARPWIALRMPIFGEENVKGLGASLAAQDGVGATAGPAADATPEVPLSDEDLEIGRQLVGRTGLNCVSCHDIRGIPSIGVRGPDLANVAGRVREECFHAWLTDPQRFTPGTRMPTVFFGGKSAAPQFLDDGLPADAPELVLSRLLDEYRTAREERFANTTRRAQAASGLLVVGLLATLVILH